MYQAVNNSNKRYNRDARSVDYALINKKQSCASYQTQIDITLTTRQQGFTLIELMVSLVLGLLISAAVIQVFITSQRVDRIQTGGANIQDKVIFGLQPVERQVRLANLGNEGRPLDDTTVNGGIILSAEDNTSTTGASLSSSNVKVDGGLAKGYLTRSNDMDTAGTNAWSGISNTTTPSDQLTIQYTNDTPKELYDCEGAEIARNARVIERYYLKEGTASTSTRKNLNLICDAGRINGTTLEDFGNTSGNKTAVIIEGVDQFNIRLGVQIPAIVNGKNTYKYADMTVKNYMLLTGKKPYITTIKMSLLARSTTNSPEGSGETFNILGNNQT